MPDRAAYPALRRFTDSDYLPDMSEPTVVDYAQVGVAYGLLRGPEYRRLSLFVCFCVIFVCFVATCSS